MKKKILLFVSVVCFSITTLVAQQNMQGHSPEERTKTTMEKMAPLKLDDETKAKTELIISEFYNSQQTAIKEMRANRNVSRDSIMAKRKELAAVRDAKLKLIFKEEQYKKWIDEIEPGLRPQRVKN